MIAKKSKKADLERKRFAFFQIGLLVAGSLCLAAFEYTTANYQEQMAIVQFGGDDKEFYDVPQEIIVEEIEPQINKPTPAIFTLDTDTIDIVDIDIKNLIVSNDKKITFDDKDLKFDPNAGLNLDITGNDNKEKEYEWVDKFPEFVGGEAAMGEWISKNVEYPEMQRQMGLGGVAYVSFVVEKDGSISSVTTLNENDDVDQAFLSEGKRVIKAMPKWIPGENMGKKVRVRFMVPINFTTH